MSTDGPVRSITREELVALADIARRSGFDVLPFLGIGYYDDGRASLSLSLKVADGRALCDDVTFELTEGFEDAKVHLSKRMLRAYEVLIDDAVNAKPLPKLGG